MLHQDILHSYFGAVAILFKLIKLQLLYYVAPKGNFSGKYIYKLLYMYTVQCYSIVREQDVTEKQAAVSSFAACKTH